MNVLSVKLNSKHTAAKLYLVLLDNFFAKIARISEKKTYQLIFDLKFPASVSDLVDRLISLVCCFSEQLSDHKTENCRSLKVFVRLG